MKIAVVGSEGYIGRELCRQLEIQKHELLRIDALVYGQVPTPGTEVVRARWCRGKMVKLLENFKPDHVVWLAAYAHDPEGSIDPHDMHINNAALPSQVATTIQCPFTFTSSLSVFSPHGTYPESKRKLEFYLEQIRPGFHQRINILRFGTLFGCVGEPSDVESFRSHLLLNSMVVDAISNYVIRCGWPELYRPVYPIDNAVAAIIRDLEPGPRGTIQNLYETCATLEEFAREVQDVAKDYDVHAEIERGVCRVDPRDYGWGHPDFRWVRPRLHLLFRWVRQNLPKILKYREQFPANLYRYVEGTRKLRD